MLACCCNGVYLTFPPLFLAEQPFALNFKFHNDCFVITNNSITTIIIINIIVIITMITIKERMNAEQGKWGPVILIDTPSWALLVFNRHRHRHLHSFPDPKTKLKLCDQKVHIIGDALCAENFTQTQCSASDSEMKQNSSKQS